MVTGIWLFRDRMVRQNDAQIWVGWIMEPLNDNSEGELSHNAAKTLIKYSSGNKCTVGDGYMGLELR